MGVEEFETVVEGFFVLLQNIGGFDIEVVEMERLKESQGLDHVQQEGVEGFVRQCLVVDPLQ